MGTVNIFVSDELLNKLCVQYSEYEATLKCGGGLLLTTCAADFDVQAERARIHTPSYAEERVS